MTRRIAIYARVSTDGQSPENQLEELKADATSMKWEIVKTYVDHGVSGAKEKESRAAFKALCEGAVRREFDIIMAWSVDILLKKTSTKPLSLPAEGLLLFLFDQDLNPCFLDS